MEQAKSWGLQQSGQRKVFATALEVHYPSLLCDAIAENIALALHRMDVVPATTQSVTQSARAFAHYQAGTTKIPTFVPEYKGKLLSLFFQGTRIWPLHLDTTNDLKLLHEVQVGGEHATAALQVVGTMQAQKHGCVFRHECPECYTCLSLPVQKVPQPSKPTWVSVQDVVLNSLDRPRNQVNYSQSSATFTKHTSTRCLAHVAMVLVGVSRLDTKWCGVAS